MPPAAVPPAATLQGTAASQACCDAYFWQRCSVRALRTPLRRPPAHLVLQLVTVGVARIGADQAASSRRLVLAAIVQCSTVFRPSINQSMISKKLCSGRKQSSPLVFAIIVAVLGTVGGLFLINVEEVGEEIVSEVRRSRPLVVTHSRPPVRCARGESCPPPARACLMRVCMSPACCSAWQWVGSARTPCMLWWPMVASAIHQQQLL